MIQQNEIRIGNIFNYKGHIIKFAIEDFAEIDNNSQFLELFLREVELTEEWLIRCGFIKDSELWYRFHHEELMLTYDIDDNCICVYGCWTYKKIKYLHKMQNLCFELSGKELDIKL